MISVIICSVQPDRLVQAKKNIAETIGVAHEIIATNNSSAKDGICKVYNEAGKKANFPFLCFMHEDILFESSDWGNRILKHFEDQNLGLLGIAGGDTKSLAPSSWSVPFISNEINIIQHYKFDERPAERILVTTPSGQAVRKRVVVLDGVWLCVRKKVFDEFKFDESRFPGFHGYDIDYSLQVNTKYSVCVVFDILIHHFSEGSPDRNWVNSAILLSRKWKTRLPVSVYNLSSYELAEHHWKSLHFFLMKLFELRYHYSRIVQLFFAYSFTRYFRWRKFLSLGKFIIVHKYSTMNNEIQSPGYSLKK